MFSGKSHIRIFIHILFPLLLLSLPGTVCADGPHSAGISTDGSLGPEMNLPGPDYTIGSELGTRAGANLFHSFQHFHLQQGESATFTGPDSVQNIISRITGGQVSFIDGKLASSIPGADLYLLNPAGLIFGPHAFLDLTGSFHVSTADYLRMGEGERFFSRPAEGELLSVAAPSAFGFLDENPGLIRFEGKGEISEGDWDGAPSGLSVAQGEALSVIGGNIEMEKGTWFTGTEIGELGYVNTGAEILLGSLSAPGGRISLSAVSSAGEVRMGDEGPDMGDAAGGSIRISGKSLLDVSGDGAGSIFIRSGEFVSEDSSLYAKNTGDTDGGTVRIAADRISFEKGSEIYASAYAAGKGTDVKLQASGTLTFSGMDEQKNVSKIIIETHSPEEAGDTGNVDIHAQDIHFSDGAYIHNGTWGSGNSGNMTVQAENDILLSGIGHDAYLNYYLSLYMGENPVYPDASFGGFLSNVQMFSTGGNGGDIRVEADNLILSDSASILSTTVGAGNGGSISIEVADSVSLSGSAGPYVWAAGINSATFPPGEGFVSGDAGDVSLKAGNLEIRDGRALSSDSFSPQGGEGGKSGDLDIRVSGNVLLSGVNPYSIFDLDVSQINVGSDADSGDAGNIFLQAGSLTIEDGAMINAGTYGKADGGNISMEIGDSVTVRGSSPMTVLDPEDNRQLIMQDSFSRIEARSGLPDADSGNSGTISVSARNIHVSDGGFISTSTAGGGSAGNIGLEVGRLALDRQARIISESTLAESGGAAGSISLRADTVSLSADSIISTEALCTGSGKETDGKIEMETADMLYLSSSAVTTSVKGGDGKGGDIEISHPEVSVLNHSTIRANAYEGSGGNIRIVSGQFIPSADSIVEASSEKGIDGNVRIESPDTDVSGGVSVMSPEYLDAAKWQSTPCEHRSAENVSTFVLQGKDGVPASFDDWQPLYELSRSPFDSGSLRKSAQIREENLKTLNRNSPEYLDKTTELALIYQAAGYHCRALSVMEKALSLAENGEDDSRTALFFSTLGDIYLCLGKTEAAARAFLKGEPFARNAENPRALIILMNNMTNGLAADGSYAAAAFFYKKAVAKIEKSGENEDLIPKILLNLIRTALRTGAYGEIRGMPENLFTRIGSQPDSYEKAFDFISLGRMLKHAGEQLSAEDRALSLSALQQAKRISGEAENSRLLSYACGYTGELYESRKQYADALRMTRKALFHAGQDADIRYLWQWQIGRLLSAGGDTEKAVKAYRDAADTLSPIRGELLTGFREQENAFHENIRPVYLGLADLLLKQIPENSPGTESGISEVINIMETLKTAELEDYFADECISVSQNRNTGIRQTVPGTAILYPVILPDRLVLLLTLPDGMRKISAAVSSEELNSLIVRCREHLQTRPLGRYMADVRQLYDLIIRPLETLLDRHNTDTLIVAPDGGLRQIPFATLHDGKRFLIEKYAVGTIPAVSLTDISPPAADRSDILIAGLSESVMGFPALPGVQKELREIREIMPEGKVLENRDFTNKNLDREFKRHHYTLLHMATHGIFGGTPEESFLLTYDGRLTMNRLEYLIGLGRYRSPVELLTLSACQTALGDERAAMGLAGVAVKAGVKSAVATLWYVDDESASYAIRHFYQQLRQEGLSKVKAMQAVQKKMIAGHRYGHPVYWSPFLVIGNWM